MPSAGVASPTRFAITAYLRPPKSRHTSGHRRGRRASAPRGDRRASAPVVVFAEDHCLPEPGWAAALPRAHEDEAHAAVGPVIANASPATAVSWADAGPSGDVELLPVHDSIDEREALLQHGKRLEALLESEAVLHMERKAKRE